MKKILLAILMFATVANAQTKIPPPSYADALKNLKGSESLWNELKKNYGIGSQAEVKIIENPDKSYGYNYSTYALPYNYKFPPDLILPSFTIITKKMPDGSYYEIPVSVVYRRSDYKYEPTWGGNVISYNNTYSYYWCEIGAPIAVGKKLLSIADRSKLFFSAIEDTYTAEKKPGNDSYVKYVIGTDLMDVVQFKDFTEYDTEEFRVKIINGLEETWLFNCNAIIAEFNSDRSKILKLEECKFEIQASAKLVDGKWKIAGNSANERPFYFTRKETVKEIHNGVRDDNKPYDKLFATLENVSTTVLSQSLTEVPVPIASETAIENTIIKPLKDIFNSKLTSEEEIIKLLKPLFKPEKADALSKNMAGYISNWHKSNITFDNFSVSLRRGSETVENGAANFREQFVTKPIYINLFVRLLHNNTAKKPGALNDKMFVLTGENKANEDYLSDYVKLDFDSDKGKWYLNANLTEKTN